MRRLALALASIAALNISVEAHVRITSPTPRTVTDLKVRHCGGGTTGSARANVQTFSPGATIHLTWDMYIAHPGWFRISFNPNGDTFRIPPGDAAGQPAGYPTEDLTGMLDPDGLGSTIIADRIPTTVLSRDIVLPTAECNNCTLQLIEMMTDKPPYTTDTASNDIYFACVDLVISATAPMVDAGPTPDATDPGDTTSSGCGCQG